MTDKRPSPDALLRAATREARGQLKIFLGAAPGVGKTFEMLSEGAARLREGLDVVVAVVETHGRAETEALVAPFEIVPRRTIDYRGQTLTEMDLDGVLARHPALALVDELAHSNVEGSRHPKRWQDIVELLDAGIDVYTTLNVQHIESLNDVVASFTRVRVRETVPDAIFDDAEIEIVDIPPDELIARLKDGKVYVPAEATRALGHFFSKPNLSALREMALRQAAHTVDRRMLEELDAGAVAGSFAAGERVLVAVSELPGADALVRTAKRLADALRAPWSAVFIETPRAEGFSPEQKARVAATLRLAATLGATIATIAAESVTAGLTAQVQAMRATQLVLGKSRRNWWFTLRHGSVVETMLDASDGLAVHVIPADATRHSAPKQRWVPPNIDPLVYLAIAALVAATTVVGVVAQPLIGSGPLDLLYLVPVIVAANRYGLGPGLVTGVAAALAYNFFFLPPVYTFTITDPQSVITVVILLGIATFTSRLTGATRSRAAIGVRNARTNADLAAFAQALTRVSDARSTAETVVAEAARLLDVNARLFVLRGGEPEMLAAVPPGEPLTPVDRAALDWAFARGEPSGSGTATLNGSDWQFHPLKTSLGILAVLGVARSDGGEPVPSDHAVLLANLVAQASLAHERLHLESEVRELSVLKERDRLRIALLSSIGHDLRTPMTSVRSAIGALAAEQPASEPVRVAQAEVQRLERFLGNLLSMVRLESGALTVGSEVIDLTDAIGGAVHDLRDPLRGKHIDLKVPASLPFVRADPKLLHQVLINLLANAAEHGRTDGTITVEGRREADGITLTIRDDGAGIDPALGNRVFDLFVSGTGSDRAGGSGLGLAIVKGFADAMDVGVSAANHADGGAAFGLKFREIVAA